VGTARTCAPSRAQGRLTKLLRGAKLGLQLNEHIAEPGDVVFQYRNGSASKASSASFSVEVDQPDSPTKPAVGAFRSVETSKPAWL
jgi:hypothetical protein